ncbi:ankyrin repeat-containing domain protein [Gorgonomyces haynaldii]|nr:ankyrin repeat-containing domain protein [Gorgonomyces haynaldii]
MALNLAERMEMPLLHMAVLYGHVEICEWLLDQGSKVNQECCGDYTPLTLAIYLQHDAICRLLVKRKATINRLTDYGMTMLNLAVVSGTLEMINILLENDAMLNLTHFTEHFRLVLSHGRLECIQWFLQQPQVRQLLIELKHELDFAICLQNTANVVVYFANLPPFQWKRQSWLDKAILIAVERRQLQDIGILLEDGARINGDPKSADSPIACAARGNAVECIQFLYDRGASLHIKDTKKTCPLLSAVQFNSFEACQTLIELDQQIVQWSCRSGRDNPLHVAARYNSLIICKLLIENGADVNSRSKDGETALMMAVRLKREEIAAYLIASGGDLELSGSPKDAPETVQDTLLGSAITWLTSNSIF